MTDNKNKTLGRIASDSAPRDESISPTAPADPGRRRLLKGAGFVGVAAVGTATTRAALAQTDGEGAAAHSSKSRPAPASREALEVLTALEAETLEALCDCLIPSDAQGPGAREARAVHYIDRSLASHNIAYRDDYLASLSAIDDYARSRRGRPFARLIRDQQESILAALEDDRLDGCSPSAAGFFSLLRSHCIDGTFGDPYYGGNQDLVGWDLLRYPGVRLSVSEADVAMGPALPSTRLSAYDHATYTKLQAQADAQEGEGEGYA